MTRTWLEPPPVLVPADLAAAVGGHPLVAETLVRRGITTPAAARAFLDPDAYAPTPPEALPGLISAVERLEAAIQRGEPVCVWGDFDVDGQTATTVLVSALADLGAQVTYHIPVRATEGHGVGLGVLREVIAAGARVILTCDTGIAAHEAAAFARDHGVDFIISDHHDLPAVLPDAYAIVNPKLQESGVRGQGSGAISGISPNRGDLSQDREELTQDGAGMSPNWGDLAQDGDDLAQDGGEPAQDGASLSPDGGELAQDRKRLAQDGAGLPPNGGELAQNSVPQSTGLPRPAPQAQSGGLRYSAVSRADAHAGRDATADENASTSRGLRNTELVRPPLGAGPDAGEQPAPAAPRAAALGSLPGVGVAYKLAEALYRRAGRPQAAEGLLDLAALGIVADLAELSGDTRTLLQRGLAALRKTRRLGLHVLMETAELDPTHLGEEHISFVIAPRLNAQGRLADANVAVEFLTLGLPRASSLSKGVLRHSFQSQDAALRQAQDREMGALTQALVRARILAADLEALNSRRKLLCDQVYAATEAQLQRDPALLAGGALVLAGPGWHPGVVGIVASRLVERYGKPAMLLSLPAAGSAEPARGSARSVDGVNITAAIAAHAGLLLGFGGHPMAAGLSLPVERVAEFRRALSRTVEKMAAAASVVSGLPIDGYLPLSDLSLDFVADLERLAPFGPGNPPLTLVSRDLRVRGKRTVGRDQSHLLVIVEDAWGTAQEVIWWDGAGEPLPDGKFDLAYTVRANDYRGVRGVQATWVEARPVGEGAAEVKAQAEIEVVDYRGVADPAAVLRQLQADPAVLIWCEDASAAQYEPRITQQLVARHRLFPASHLAIWTAPPGPAELRAALARVEPSVVILFGRDPGLDQPAAFLRQLSGLVKHALNRGGGRARISELAAALAAREATVRQGLGWLAGRGHIAIAGQEEDLVSLTPDDGLARPESADAAARLEALLAETAAYRAYFVTADKDRLIRAFADSPIC